MNLDYNSAKQLLEGILDQLIVGEQQEVVFGVPFPYLDMALKLTKDHKGVHIAAQNVSHESSGAFTGEVSASMLASMGVAYVIVGHSERRAYYNESNAIVAQKVNQILEHKMKPILCIGETLDTREAGEENSFVLNQLEESLDGVKTALINQVVIAYEPVWAIGTGKTATPEQAEAMHHAIAAFLESKYDSELPILYGGSMKPANAEELLKQPHIDGGLIGGASLKVDSFKELIRIGGV